MGYRDDFYIEANIVGYTGHLGVKPTVYFASADEVGRITQDHNNKENIGRNIVRNKANYTIENFLKDDDGLFHANEPGHRSRNPVFQKGVPTTVPAEGGSKKQVGVFNKDLTNFERSRLASAIKEHKDLKKKSQK